MKEMNNQNSLISDVLSRYAEREYAPKHAVLLNGKWGCGKSFFINEWKKTYDSNKNYEIMYTSAFGLKSISDLELQMMIRSDKRKNKTVKSFFTNAVNLASNVISYKFGIGASDAATIFVDYWMDNSSKKQKILIIDDIERTMMPICEIFGFVSKYIESTNVRIILIGNEEEIKDCNYTTMKEKVVGETVVLQSDIQSILGYFCKECGFSNNESNDIIELVHLGMIKLNEQNLRAARQTISKARTLKKYIEKSISYIE